MNGPEQRELGVLATKIEALEEKFDEHRREARESRAEMRADVTALRGSVQQVLDQMNGWRGGWRVMVVVAGIAGTLGGLAVKFLPFLK